uniref:LIM zinc-binding domain-containing protein n=1 Tax=Sinocyclocheilus rhinocerous TaxID=307959 RepID=A0A673LJZ1_9TELE
MTNIQDRVTVYRGFTVYCIIVLICTIPLCYHCGCFHCEVCKMTLNMKNYKGYDKKPYCNAHYPKTSFTIVTDTPENLRLKQQSELQSQVSVTPVFPGQDSSRIESCIKALSRNPKRVL